MRKEIRDTSVTYTLEIADFIVRVTRKKMKSIRVKVTHAGEVCVSAPFGVSDNKIRQVLESRLDWIYTQKQDLANSPQAKAEKATKEQQEAWRAVIEACVPSLIEVWGPILGVKVNQVVYRNMKSRWGSCQPSTGRICINTRLALYPPECLEYVVVHELCHLLVANHGPDFKALLGRVMPDWKTRANKLRL